MNKRPIPNYSPSIRPWKRSTLDKMNTPEIDTQLGVLEAEIQKIEIRPLSIKPTDNGRAGSFVMFDRYGTLAVSRGYDHLTSDESIENGNTANVYTYAETEQRFG
jgi:ParB family chromosome partitioning protein